MWYWCGHQAVKDSVNTAKACSTGTLTVVLPSIGGMVAAVMAAPVRGGTVRRAVGEAVVGGGLLGGLVKVGQRLVPHAFQPCAQGADAVRVEPVDAAGALGLGHDQAAVAEHLEVLGDGGAADRQLVGQLLHRGGPAGEQLEDGASGRVTEQTQPRISVS